MSGTLVRRSRWWLLLFWLRSKLRRARPPAHPSELSHAALAVLPVQGVLKVVGGAITDTLSITVKVEDWMIGYCGGWTDLFAPDSALRLGTDYIRWQDLRPDRGLTMIIWSDSNGCMRRRVFLQLETRTAIE